MINDLVIGISETTREQSNGYDGLMEKTSQGRALVSYIFGD
jgi:hypothetical protein